MIYTTGHITMHARQPETRSRALIRSFLLLAAACLFVRPALGGTSDEPQVQTNPETASVDAGSLPDAPSALSASHSSAAVQGTVHPLDQEPHPSVTVRRVPISIARDGVNILVSPAYIRTNDLKWLLPLAGAAAAAFATDTKTMTEVVSSNPSFNQTNVNVSNGLVGGLIAVPVAMFGVGQLRHQEHMTETGILGSEGMFDAAVVDELVKLCAFRERPNVDHGQGEFFIGSAGVDSSFISEHSMIAWSSAAVIAGEYPSKWKQIGVYTLATGVSLTRVMGQQHFPSDVLLGAAGGWLIGHYVYRAHHHRELTTH
jgi:membrane-associated phospholipid phosphatase